MPRLKSGHISPTETEDAAITQGIEADPDTCELGAADMKRMRKLGRPKSNSPKIQLTVRYDAEIVTAFKASGQGWQTRMNDALRDWLKTHRV